MSRRNRMVASLVLVAILLTTLVMPVMGQSPLTRMRNVAINVLSVTSGLTTDDIAVSDDATVGSDLTLEPQANLTLTMNGWITPTGTFQTVRSAGAVSISGANIADGDQGDLLILYNAGAQTITISETTGLISAGNIALGTLDSVTLVYSGTTWIQIGASNN